MPGAYERIRGASARLLRTRDFDAGGVSVRDINLAGRPARLYRPPAERSGQPMLFFHGGAFFSGSLETHERLCTRLAAHLGDPLIAAPYGLAPRTSASQMLANAVASADALREDAGALGLEAGNISLGGDSAGGYLALRTALSLGERAAGLAMLYPLIQLDPSAWWREAFRGSRSAGLPSIAIMAGMGLSREFAPLYDLDLAGLPPTVILCGGGLDPVAYDAPRLEEALAEAKVPVKRIAERGLIHGELCFPDRSARADRALRSAAEALRALA